MKFAMLMLDVFPIVALDVSVTGQAQTVWSYDNNKAEQMNLCDFHPVAYRTADGRTHLSITHFRNYRLSGSSLDSLSPTPEATFNSDAVHSSAWGDFGHHQWVASPFTEDGSVFYALAHSEWYACLQYGVDPVKGCSVGNNQINSWVNGITLFQSSDGGASWSPVNDNTASHVVLAPSMSWPEGWNFWESQEMMHYGFFHPSNIVKEGGFFYATCYVLVRDLATAKATRSGFALLRVSSLASTTGWTVWDGASWVLPSSWDSVPFIAVNVNSDMNTLFYSKVANAYVFMFELEGQLEFTTSTTLQKPVFSPMQAVSGSGIVTVGTYAIVQDPTVTGFNFDTVGDSGYIYGCRNNGGLSRDVVRWPVSLSVGPSPSPTPMPLPSNTHRIYRCVDSTGHHSVWASSSCEGVATLEVPLGCLADDAAAGSTPLNVCYSGGDYLVSTHADCEGLQMVGSLGYIWQGKSAQAPTPLYRCLLPGDHFASIDGSCEGATSEGLLGYMASCSSNAEGDVLV